MGSSEEEFDQGDREHEEEEVHQVGDKDVESDKSDSDEDNVLLPHFTTTSSITGPLPLRLVVGILPSGAGTSTL